MAKAEKEKAIYFESLRKLRDLVEEEMTDLNFFEDVVALKVPEFLTLLKESTDVALSNGHVYVNEATNNTQPTLV